MEGRSTWKEKKKKGTTTGLLSFPTTWPALPSSTSSLLSSPPPSNFHSRRSKGGRGGREKRASGSQVWSLWPLPPLIIVRSVEAGLPSLVMNKSRFKNNIIWKKKVGYESTVVYSKFDKIPSWPFIAKVARLAALPGKRERACFCTWGLEKCCYPPVSPAYEMRIWERVWWKVEFSLLMFQILLPMCVHTLL